MTVENPIEPGRSSGSRANKYSVDWGVDVVKELWLNFKAMGADFKNKRVLDFGCAWGYMCKLGMDEGASTCVGVDILAHWDKVEDQSILKQDGLRLICGDLLEVEELQSMTFDMILSSGTLFLLDSIYLDKVLEWFCDHLTPGGEAFLRTRCVTAKLFNDLGSRLAVPGAQLLFSRRAVNRVLAEKGYQEFKSHLGYVGATWVMACHSAGFNVVNVCRHSNAEVVSTAAGHEGKTRWLSQLEMATGEITIHLRKPLKSPDLALLRKSD